MYLILNVDSRSYNQELRTKLDSLQKQNAQRRLRGMSRCKHIKLFMRSDNHSLFTPTNNLVTGRLLLASKLQRGKGVDVSIDSLLSPLVSTSLSPYGSITYLVNSFDYSNFLYLAAKLVIPSRRW